MKHKSKLVLLALLVVTGCTNIVTTTPIVQQPSQPTTPNFNFIPKVEVETGKKLNFEKRTLSNGGSGFILRDLANRWKNSSESLINVSGFALSHENYAGDYVKFSATEIRDAIVLKENNLEYQFIKKDGFYYFRSMYQGNFSIKITKLDGTSKIVTIENKMKYQFTEEEIYRELVSEYENKNFYNVLDTLDLYDLAYNNSRKKTLDFLNANTLVELGRSSEAKAKISELKKLIGLSQEEVVNLFELEFRLSGNNFILDDFYIRNSNSYPVLAENIKNKLLTKRILTPEERRFLESRFPGIILPKVEVAAPKPVTPTIPKPVVTPPVVKPTTPVKESPDVLDNLANIGNSIGNAIGNTFTKGINDIKENIAPITNTVTSATNSIANVITAPKTDNKTTAPTTTPTTTNIAKAVETVKSSASSGATYNSGKNAYNSGRYSEAIVYLSKISDSEAKSNLADTNYYLGDAYVQTGNYAKAIDAYKKHTSSNDDSIKKAESLYNLGVSYDKIGDKASASNSFKKVMEQYPGTSWARKSNIYLLKLKK